MRQRLEQLTDRKQFLQAAQSHDGHFQQHSRVAAPAHAALGRRPDVQAGQDRIQARLLGLSLDRVADVRRKRCLFQIGARFQQHQRPPVLDQLIDEFAHLQPAFDPSGDQVQARLGIVGEDGRGEFDHAVVAGRTQDRVNVLGRELTGTRREELIEERLRVAHGTRGSPGHESQCVFVRFQTFPLHDRLQLLEDLIWPDVREVEPLAPRENRDRKLLHIGRRENKLHVLGRFFQRLQQCVERARREHVNFVDDVNLVATASRAEADVLPEVADVVDLVVAGTVDLLHVDVLTLGDGLAAFAFAARRGRRAFFAVECFGENPGRTGLPRAARPGEEVGMGDAIRLERVDERLRDVFLADEFGELLRPIPPRHHGVFRGCRRGR